MIYVLSIGIDDYAIVNPLRGCHKDVNRLYHYLWAQYGPEGSSQPGLISRESYRTLKSPPNTTYQAIIREFEAHLIHNPQLSQEDVALFHFSGHGTREKGAPEFQEYDGKHEALVCYDSFQAQPDGGKVPCLADKELRALLSQVSAKVKHLLVILDCCFSGSGHREVLPDAHPPADEQARLISWDEDVFVPARPLASYYPYTYQAGEQIALPPATYVALGACDYDEKARETPNGGYFTTALIESLKEGPDMSYKDLFVRLRARIQAHTQAQTPQLEYSGEVNPYSQVLNGRALPGARRPRVQYDAQAKAFALDLGAIHGLDPDPERLRRHHFPIWEGDGQGAPVAHASLWHVGVARSLLQLHPAPNQAPLAPDKLYVAGLHAFPLRLMLRGEDQALQHALAQSPNLEVEPHTASVPAPYEVVVQQEGYDMYRQEVQADGGMDRQLLHGVEGIHSQADRELAIGHVVEQLQKIARWERGHALRPPRHSQIDLSQFSFQLYPYPSPAQKFQAKAATLSFAEQGRQHGTANPFEETISLELPYDAAEKRWKGLLYSLGLQNHSPVDVHAYVLNFGRRYNIDVLGREQIKPVRGRVDRYTEVKEVELFDSYYDPPRPKALFFKDENVEEVVYAFSLLLSTEPLDHFNFGQEALGGKNGFGRRVSVDSLRERHELRSSLAEDAYVPPRTKAGWTLKRLLVRVRRGASAPAN